MVVLGLNSANHNNTILNAIYILVYFNIHAIAMTKDYVLERKLDTLATMFAAVVI